MRTPDAPVLDASDGREPGSAELASDASIAYALAASSRPSMAALRISR